MKNTTTFLFNKPFLINQSTIWWNNQISVSCSRTLFSHSHKGLFGRSGSAQLSSG